MQSQESMQVHSLNSNIMFFNIMGFFRDLMEVLNLNVLFVLNDKKTMAEF